MLQRGLLPLGVALHARWIRHPELLRDVVQHHRRHIEWRGQKRPQVTNRHQLQREPQPGRITTTLRDDVPVSVIQEEEPL
jgi:hypothetical protein